MLQMSHPKCKGVVNSHFLAEITTIECSQCRENIPVQDVYIATPYFTIDRDDFVNRTFRFQKLLRDVESERLLLAKDRTASAKSIECLEQFHASLHELLDGARDCYRVEIPSDIYVEVNASSRVIRGKLLNLSAEGCSIGFEKIETVPREKTELNIEFFFNGLAEILKVQAKVLWTRKQTEAEGFLSISIGVRFTDIDENTRSCIWNYIINNTPVPFKRI